MNISVARQAIEAILDAVDDYSLPAARIEIDTRGTTAWFGGMGLGIGTASKGGKLDANVHRNSGINHLFQQETARRIDLTFMVDGSISEAFVDDEAGDDE